MGCEIGFGTAAIRCRDRTSISTENRRIDYALFVKIFANEEIKIAVECDGHDFHEKTPHQAARDSAKNGDLQIAGWRLLRFTGRQIRQNPKYCATRVAELAKNEIEGQLQRRGLIP
jgi:very-short-patch-repair endonuclease